MRAQELLRLAAGLPFAGLDALAPGTSLIVAPHPDDESLGCGGLIACLADAGRPPVIVVATDGTGSHPNSIRYPAARLRALREAELRGAVRVLGADPGQAHFLRLPDTQAPREGPAFTKAAETIAALARDRAVRTIFATWPHDPHGDHGSAALIAAAAAQLCGARLRFYPVWGWLLPPEQEVEAGPPSGVRLDVAPVLGRKRRAIAAYESQYTAMITDDPAAFRLPADLLAIHDRPFEVYLDP